MVTSSVTILILVLAIVAIYGWVIYFIEQCDCKYYKTRYELQVKYNADLHDNTTKLYNRYKKLKNIIDSIHDISGSDKDDGKLAYIIGFNKSKLSNEA